MSLPPAPHESCPRMSMDSGTYWGGGRVTDSRMSGQLRALPPFSRLFVQLEGGLFLHFCNKRFVLHCLQGPQAVTTQRFICVI